MNRQLYDLDKITPVTLEHYNQRVENSAAST
jgi:hypothetical protein